jgi:hypothetical protein
MAEKMKCPVHGQDAIVEQEGDVKFAVCSCVNVGRNPTFGHRVWEQRGVSQKSNVVSETISRGFGKKNKESDE